MTEPTPEAVRKRADELRNGYRHDTTQDDMWEFFARRELTREPVRSEDVEALARIVFSNRGFYPGEIKPKWVDGGNSHRQEDCRDIARAIIARYGAPQAPVAPEWTALLNAADMWRDAYDANRSSGYNDVCDALRAAALALRPKPGPVDPVAVGMAEIRKACHLNGYGQDDVTTLEQIFETAIRAALAAAEKRA